MSFCESNGIKPPHNGKGCGSAYPDRKDGKPRKRNKYAMNCCICGHLLMPGEAALSLSEGKWKGTCIRTYKYEPLPWESISAILAEAAREQESTT